MPAVESLPLRRFCAFLWWFFTHRADDPHAVEKFRSRLWQPPPGVEVTDERSPWSPEAETAAFASLKADVGGGKA